MERKTILARAIREYARRRWADKWKESLHIVGAGTVLDERAFTIGFARRFATYKRADLIFHDPERLRRLLVNPWRPVQLVFAGKAHPADEPGKQLLAACLRVHPRGAVRGADRFPRRLRDAPRPPPRAGRRPVVEHAAPAARGVRDERNEGRAERGAPAEHARRMVGRGIRRPERLGDPAGRRKSGDADAADAEQLYRCWRRRWYRCTTRATAEHPRIGWTR